MLTRLCIVQTAGQSPSYASQQGLMATELRGYAHRMIDGQEHLGVDSGKLVIQSSVFVIALSLGGCAIHPPSGEPVPTLQAPPAMTSSPTPTTKHAPDDLQSRLFVYPVDYEGNRVIVAEFDHVSSPTLVTLELETGAGWEVVATQVSDGGGRAEFSVRFDEGTYRARSSAASAAPLTTMSVASLAQWRRGFHDSFSGPTLNEDLWSVPLVGVYSDPPGPRLCSASHPDMVRIEDDNLVLSVQEAHGDRAKSVREDRAKVLGVKASEACPFGVFDNGIVSTRNRYSFEHGIAAVRMRVPDHAGPHAAAWLQSLDPAGSEIDFIETFGQRHGITNRIHWWNSAGDAETVGGYVKSIPEVMDPAWWQEYHTYSVEWTPDEFIFRVDGLETFRTSDGNLPGEKYALLSLLTSDWALDRLDTTKLPLSLHVDWFEVWQAE